MEKGVWKNATHNVGIIRTMEHPHLAPCEGTASVEPAGKAESATAAKSEALMPWAKGGAKRKVNAVLQRSPKRANTTAGTRHCD